jgi:predicted DNA-binding helix-hairpin-helix protein
MRWVDQIRRTKPRHLGWSGRWPSITTQYVVGAVGESDLELLSTTSMLINELKLARAYFSAFRPVSDTPLESTPGVQPRRQHHLYQASFLLRDYGYDLEDLPFTISGNLPADTDPKTAWAREHLANAPLEINHAERHELLRIPGIGPKGARAVLKARRKERIKFPEQLRKLGINPRRSLPFILLDGHRPSLQLSFF